MPGDPLARARRVSLGDLKDERFVMLDPQSNIYTIFCEECRTEGFFPNIILTHTRHRPLLSAVKRGIGISALPPSSRGHRREKAQGGHEVAHRGVAEMTDPLERV